MFITELSIKRPTISWVMSLILIIFGLFEPIVHSLSNKITVQSWLCLFQFEVNQLKV